MRQLERKRNRLNGFDYGRDALYFITSCVKDKACVFGEVVDDEMQLNDFGNIAKQQWHWLEEQYTYVISHAFVVMPNHIHGIIEIDRDTVGTGRDLSNRAPDNPRHALSDSANKFKTLSQLIGAYKTTTSKIIRAAGLADFAWQRSFHDHIIRSDEAYSKIRDYILTNPDRWADDVFYER